MTRNSDLFRRSQHLQSENSRRHTNKRTIWIFQPDYPTLPYITISYSLIGMMPGRYFFVVRFRFLTPSKKTCARMIRSSFVNSR